MIARLRAIRRFAALLLALWTASAWADTLELRDGQTLTGQYAGGSKGEIRFQIGSQTLRFPLAEVSRLTIGAAAQSDFQRAAKDALRQLKALASVTEGGTTYQNYSARVEDAKVKIDQFLDEHRASPLPQFNASIADSLGFYVAASLTWNAKISNAADIYELPRNPYVQKCEALQHAVSEQVRKKGQADWYVAFLISEGGTPYLWECARNSLLDAEKALGR